MKPILFSTEMVRAILGGNKTQTRRVIKPQPIPEPYANDSFGIPFWRWKDCQWIDGGIGFPASGIQDHAPHRPGDILYVRETWQHCYDMDGNDQFVDGTGRYVYAASPEDVPQFSYWVRDDGTHAEAMPWRPSIHMPRAAARIFLRVTDVRVERVQDISLEDIECEGLYCDGMGYTKEHPAYPGGMRIQWIKLWDSINAKRGFGWAANPWVWAYTFERSEASGR